MTTRETKWKRCRECLELEDERDMKTVDGRAVCASSAGKPKKKRGSR